MLLQMALFHSFLCLSNSPLYTCTTSSISIPQSMGISVGSVLAVVNSAAMNIGVHLSFQIMFFSRWMPNSGIAGSYVKPGRRKWQPTPVFLPGESQGRGSLLGCHLWGRTGSDTTEAI